MLLTWFGKNPLRKFRIIIDNPLSANWVPVDPPAFPGVPIFRIIPLKTRTLQHSPIYGWRLKLSPGAPATVIHLVFFGLHENPLPGFLVTQAVYIDSAFYVHPTSWWHFREKTWGVGNWNGKDDAWTSYTAELAQLLNPKLIHTENRSECFSLCLSRHTVCIYIYIYLFIYTCIDIHIHIHRHVSATFVRTLQTCMCLQVCVCVCKK